VLLLILDAWGLVLELLSAYPENLSEEAVTTGYALQSALWLVGALLLLVAAVGLYARQSESAGTLELVGFLAALSGTGLLVGLICWANAFVAPTLAVEAPAVLDDEPAGTLAFGFLLSTTIFGLSWALFGVAMLRAWVYPRVATILLIIGALLVIVPLPATGFVIEVALIWLGLICLKAEGRAPATEQVGAEARPRVQ
jgi:cell division protein FtsW (lipid II flippase)